MNERSLFSNKRWFYVQLAFVIAGVVCLKQTDSYYPPYLLASAFALYTLFNNRSSSGNISKKSLYAIILLSAFIGMMITLANHNIWVRPAMPDVRSAVFYRLYKLFIILVIFAGSGVGVMNILMFITERKDNFVKCDRAKESSHPFLVFLIPFISMIVVYTFFYLCCYYPAIMSIDAIDQVSQILSGVYSNHHPLMHTLFIKMIFAPALAMTGDINRAISAYIIFQIVFLSAVFAFLVKTMADLKMPRSAMIAACIYYLVMPFHIMFSFTIWKDVVFGAFVTLFVIFMVRLLATKQHKLFDLIGFAVSSLAFGLFRSNGLFALVIVTVVAFFVLKKERRLVIIMAVSIAVALLIKHSVFPYFSVTPPDTVEKLSIPLQQVTRVFVDNGNVTDEDRELISNIIDIDKAIEEYDPGVSDPIKNMIRDHGNQQFISENSGAFISMYIRTFIHNPLEYMLAWVDQTKGYWNGGYGYMLWYWGVENNDLGIVRTIGNERIDTALGEYLWLFYNDPIFEVFVSLGLAGWVLLLALYRNIVSNNRAALMTTIPPLAIILSLLVSTPAFSEFRYVYSLFCLLPLIISMTLLKGDTDDEHHM